MPDFTLYNHGSLVVLTPTSAVGYDWAREHIAHDANRWGDGYAVEPRYVADILDGIKEDGLEVAL